MPETIEQLYANNDVQLFDLETDPHKLRNLALDQRQNGDLLIAMNTKLNALIQDEVGEDIGQMLPGDDPSNWTLDPSVTRLRP